MGTTTVFKPTAVQKKALALLKSGAKHILLFGGSRSGKTTVLVMAVIYRALRFAGSRHLICRYRAKDARSSVLRETLLPWLTNTIGTSGYTYLAHENVVTNDQYLINPIYETEIMTDVAKKSVMMNLVRHRPMLGPSIFLPTRNRGGVELHWLTAYGQQITGSKPQGAQRVELKAYTLAGFIPWYDEFEEDVFIDLGAIFIDEFTESYGQEFDRQCLLADDAPFTGAMKAEGITTVTLGSADIKGLTWKDFRDVVYKVPAEERKDCSWFLNETVLNHIANIEDADGRPIWRITVFLANENW
jgi:HK97 family phage major capsid protein